MKANIARQIAGARDRSKRWGRLGARVRWTNYYRNTTQQRDGPVGEEHTSQLRTGGALSSVETSPVMMPTFNGVNAGPKGEGATAVQVAREGAMLPRVRIAPETTREAIKKLEAQFPHLQEVRITETEEETVC